MLMNADRACMCRECNLPIKQYSRISWLDGVGPLHIRCSKIQEDREQFVKEYLDAEEIAKLSAKKIKRNKLWDFVSFVVGPMFALTNLSIVWRQGHFINAVLFSTGVALIMHGILRQYWIKNGK